MDLQVHSRSSNGTPLYERACPDCGKVLIADKRKLGKPCHPCAMRRRTTHGFSVGGKLHPVYRLFNGVKARCYCPSATYFSYYGGRGIGVCKEWLNDPAAFVEWALANGYEKGLELDRIDPDGDYSPDNCRFLSHRENSQRTRRIKTKPEQAAHVRRLLAEGVSVKVAAATAGVTYMVAWHLNNSPDVWSNVT